MAPEKPAEAVPEKKGKPAPVEMTAEDAELKANLELLVVRAGDADLGVQKLALESLRKEIRSATRRVRSRRPRGAPASSPSDGAVTASAGRPHRARLTPPRGAAARAAP
jgi:hypothetical protein